MKEIRKKTPALVLASMVTVLGAFGAEYYSNSLMSLKFDSVQGSSVNVTLLTKKPYEKSLNLVKKDANTYVIILPDINNEVPKNIQLADGIERYDVSTMPRTNQSNGYTKITIKTFNNIPISASTGIYIEDKSTKPNLIETNQPQKIEAPSAYNVMPEQNYSHNTKPQVKDIQSSTGVSQTTPVDIKYSQKQFQSTNENINNNNELINHYDKTMTVEDIEEQNKPSKWVEVSYWVMSAMLVITLIIFFFFKAKGKMNELLGDDANFEIDVPDKDAKKKESKKEKKNNKPEKSKINKTIANLDKQYTNSVTMPSVKQVTIPEVNQIEEPDEVDTIVDLDAILHDDKKQAEIIVNTPVEIEEEEENSALEDFLSSYNFEELAFNEPEEIEEEESFNEELYNRFIKDESLKFTSNDIANINLLIRSEISDEAIKQAPKSIKKVAKKVSPLEMLENFVTSYTIQQNITFTKDDIAALKKLVSVELDSDFITDLRTNPQRMLEMQEEIEKRKLKPHNVSEVLTLSVKDMLPDLSLELKKHGNKQIESNAKPEVIYYSEGYEVSTLQLDNDLKELTKNLTTSPIKQVRHKENIQYADLSYEVEKMTSVEDLPDLKDVLEHPELYEEPKAKPIEVDEEALLNNISNVTFKPFYDGEHEFEVLNNFDTEQENSNQNSPSVEEMQKEFETLNSDFQIINEEEENVEEAVNNDDINDEQSDFEELFEDNYLDFDNSEKMVLEQLQRPIVNPKNRKDDVTEELLNKINLKNTEKVQKVDSKIKELRKERQLRPKTTIVPKQAMPEICVIDNEKFNIIDMICFSQDIGCYLGKGKHNYAVITFGPDKFEKVKTYENIKSEKFQARVCETLDDGTMRYIIKVGYNKFIMNVKNNSMEFVMDLC